MRVMVFGATGELGRECARQAIERGHEVSVYVRNAGKLEDGIRQQVTVHEGDGLDGESIARALSNPCDGILFAIGFLMQNLPPAGTASD